MDKATEAAQGAARAALYLALEEAAAARLAEHLIARGWTPPAALTVDEAKAKAREAADEWASRMTAPRIAEAREALTFKPAPSDAAEAIADPANSKAWHGKCLAGYVWDHQAGAWLWWRDFMVRNPGERWTDGRGLDAPPQERGKAPHHDTAEEVARAWAGRLGRPAE